MPLAVGVRAREDRDLPGRGDAHLRALPEARLGAERARHRGGRRPAGLDVGGEPDPEVPALLPRGLLVGPELPVVDHLERPVERRLVVPAVVQERDRRLVRELRGRHEVLPPELRDVHADGLRRQVAHPLEEVRRLGSARAPVRVDRRRVGEGADHLAVDLGDLVRAREERPVEEGRDERRERRQVGAQVRVRVDPEGDDLAVPVDRHLGLGDVVPAVGVRHERLAALRRPLDRTSELLRRPGDRDLLRVEEDLGAEPAADVRRDHPHLVLGHAQHERRHEQPVHVGILGGDPAG